MIRPILLLLVAASLSSAGASAQTVTEDFEAYPVIAGNAENLSVLTLDENTIANGYGPNLVSDGCVYSCLSNTLQWNGQAWFGMPSRNLLANSGDGRLQLEYDIPVELVQLELVAFAGYPDNTTVTVYNSLSVPIYSNNYAVPGGASTVPFSYNGSDIKRIVIQSNTWSWSTIIDNHTFGRQGPMLSLSGSCPGPMTASMTGFTPNGAVAIVLGANAAAFTIPNGTCAGTVLGVTPPSLVALLNANGSGALSLSKNAGAALCGRWLQAVDLRTCATSNVVQIQ